MENSNENLEILSEGLKDGYKFYCILTLLDSNVCDNCLSLERRCFPIEEAKVGKNCPPFHDDCRCAVYIGPDTKYLSEYEHEMHEVFVTEIRSGLSRFNDIVLAARCYGQLKSRINEHPYYSIRNRDSTDVLSEIDTYILEKYEGILMRHYRNVLDKATRFKTEEGKRRHIKEFFNYIDKSKNLFPNQILEVVEGMKSQLLLQH